MLKKAATSKSSKKDEETPPASPKPYPTSPSSQLELSSEERKRREEEQKKIEEEKRKRDEERLRKEEEQKKKEEEARKKEEALKEKNKEEKRRKREWQKTDDSEELSAITSIDAECKFASYSEKVYEAFASLTELTRELNTERAWHTPEFVFIGYQGEGKSSVLEAIVGHPITNGGSTKRPIIINMINNLSCEHPKITVKRDAFIKEFSKEDRVVTLAELPDEIDMRNQATTEPINVRYEYKQCWTQTFIDTPGLVHPGEKNFEEQERLISELTKSQDKYLVFVEDCKEWEQAEMAATAERFDPKQMRSVFVYTKFNFHLMNMTSAKDVTTYLSGKPATKAKAFFVSSFADQVKLINPTPDKFKEKLGQSNQRDVNFLVKLQYDVKHDNSIGIQTLCKYVSELAHKKYQESIPDLLKQVRNIKKERNDKLSSIQHHIRTLDKNKLRAIASNYVSDFLQYVVTLLQGSEQSLEGIPNNSGYTLDDEKIHFGEWIDGAGNVRSLSAAEKKERIPNWNTKLLGGREFERLLIEFKVICEQTAVSRLTIDEIATSAGLSGLGRVPNQLWAASDLVQRNLEVIFVPLLKQLLEKATSIAKLLTTVADNIFESKRSQKFRGRNEAAEYQISVKEFPRFIWYVKDLFEQAVEAAAKESLQKCLDELQCTKHIQWENSTKRMADLKAKKIEQPAKSVEALTDEIFRDQQRRITKNVLLKCYDNFLVKMQKTITGTVQGQVAILSEEDMNEMFDLVSLITKLRSEEQKLTDILKNDTEAPFMEAAAKFRV